MSEFDVITSLQEEYGNLSEDDRYGRLECLARISVQLDIMAAADGFGPGAVLAYADVVRRDRGV